MKRILKIILLHYVFSLTGAFFLFLLYRGKNIIQNENKDITFKEVWKEQKEGGKIVLGSIIGYIILGIMLLLIFG